MKGNVFHVSGSIPLDIAENGNTAQLNTPFLVEEAEDGNGILIHALQEDGPLRLTHREARSLAAILTELTQSRK